MNERDDERRVEEFFAARRTEVIDQPADDLTWQRVVDRHRRQSRSSRWGMRAGAVAAAAAVAVGAYVVWPQGVPETPLPSGPTIENTPTPTADEPGTDDPGTDEPTGQTPETVPTDFAVTRLSDAGDGHLFATGGYGAGCTHDAVCAALLDSADGGTTWTPVADLVPFGIDRAEFADEQVGYGWSSVGAGLALTTDGGQGWTQAPLPVERIFDVAVREQRVVIAGGAGCGDGGCTEIVVAQTQAGSMPTEEDLVQQEADGAVTDLRLELTGSETFVVETGATGTAEEGAVAVQRVQSGRFESVAQPLDCGAPMAFAAAAEGDQVFLACRATAGGGSSNDVAVVSSSTGGRTWGGAGQGYAAPSAPVLLVAPDPDHLVLVTSEESLASTDGGRTFAEPVTPLPLTSAAVGGLTSAAGGLVYAWSDPDAAPAADPGYWVSSDRGQSWARVDQLP